MSPERRQPKKRSTRKGSGGHAELHLHLHLFMEETAEAARESLVDGRQRVEEMLKHIRYLGKGRLMEGPEEPQEPGEE